MYNLHDLMNSKTFDDCLSKIYGFVIFMAAPTPVSAPTPAPTPPINNALI